jgi:hypothetical protein
MAMMTEITREHVNKIHELLDHGLVTGVGIPEPGKMCVEAAICFALGLPHGDDPQCVLPSIRRLKIGLNDSFRWTSNMARAEGLRRLAIAQLGSKGAVDEKEFVARLAAMTIRTIVPPCLRRLAKHVKDPSRLLAAALRCEQEPTKANAEEAKSAAAAAAAADADAYAAAAAAAAADAYAYADAAAAAYADAYAAAAADAAADAAAAADADAAAAADLKPGEFRYGKVYWAVREAIRDRVAAKIEEVMAPANRDLLGSAIDLLDRMLPAEPQLAPVVDLELARIVCAAPDVASKAA